MESTTGFETWFTERGLPVPGPQTDWMRRLRHYWAMDAEGRVGLTRAQVAAHRLAAYLDPYCARIEVVGSVRRQRHRVKDVELLIAPRPDLLSIDVVLAPAMAEGWLRPGAKNGARLKQIQILSVARDLRDWLDVDLFICLPPAQWGVLSLIRTGPASFSKWLVSLAVVGEHHRFQDGALWHHAAPGEWHDLETPEEEDVFTALGRPFVPLAERNDWRGV